jgi:hypothetical protein
MNETNLAKLPHIGRADVEKAKIGNDEWEFLLVFVEKYFEMIDENPEVIKDFTLSQLTLLAYFHLDSEVCNGGFIQLIQNGRGSYVFDTPFSDCLRKWGVEKVAEIVDKAKVVYEKYKEELEKEKDTAEEFCQLYEDITDFEPLDVQFDEVTNNETKILKNYVENHLEEFAVID